MNIKKKIMMMVVLILGFITLIIKQVAAVTFEEWLPFELSWTSLIWFLLVMGVCVAGGSAGIAAKHYQSKNWKFSPEDLVYYLLVISASVLFFITATPIEQCFVYSASINGVLGITRNLVDSRTVKK